jgi:hypothetical protein
MDVLPPPEANKLSALPPASSSKPHRAMPNSYATSATNQKHPGLATSSPPAPAGTGFWHQPITKTVFEPAIISATLVCETTTSAAFAAADRASPVAPIRQPDSDTRSGLNVTPADTPRSNRQSVVLSSFVEAPQTRHYAQPTRGVRPCTTCTATCTAPPAMPTSLPLRIPAIPGTHVTATQQPDKGAGTSNARALLQGTPSQQRGNGAGLSNAPATPHSMPSQQRGNGGGPSNARVLPHATTPPEHHLQAFGLCTPNGLQSPKVHPHPVALSGAE